MKVATTIRVYLPNGKQLVFKEGEDKVKEIDLDRDVAYVVFEDFTSRAFVRMPIEVEMKRVTE